MLQRLPRSIAGYPKSTFHDEYIFRNPKLDALARATHAGGRADHRASVSAWPVMDDAAYYGLAGKVVRTLGPHTEADPVAILLTFLAMFGNVIGPSAHFQIEGDQHRAKLFVALSGATAKGRKGTALGRVRQILSIAAPEWERENINTGLSSGEGVVFHVRDAVTKINKDGAEDVVDGGVPDKRLMLATEEFAGALSVMERAGNTLSSILRDAWGTSRLQTMTKNPQSRGRVAHLYRGAHHRRRTAVETDQDRDGERLRKSFPVREGETLEGTPVWRLP